MLQILQQFGLPLATLDILHCLAANEDLLPFFLSCDLINVLSPFLSLSPEVHLGFRLLATLILSHFHTFLSQTKILCVNTDMASLILLRFQSAQQFLTVLQQGIEDDVPWADIITPTLLYLALHKLVFLPGSDVLINGNILSVIQNSLEYAADVEKAAALRLLCILCILFKEKLKINVNGPLASTLSSLQSGKNEELTSLSSCALMFSEVDVDTVKRKLIS